MVRLINADAFIEEARSRIDMQDMYLPVHIKEMVLDEMPTVDAVPVRHGKWIPYKAYLGKHKDSWVDEVRCSACGYAFGEPEWNYCPNCGSRMDAERKEE